MRPKDFELFLLGSARRRLKRHTGEIKGDFIALNTVVVRVLVRQRAGASAQTIVIVPDPPNLIEHHEEVVAMLSKEFKVVCLELPGFGFSHPSPRFNFTAEEQVSAIIELFEKLGVRNAILEMACLGAFIGLKVAERRPDLIRKLVLLQLPSYREAQRWSKRADLLGIIGTPWLGQLFMQLGSAAVTRHWYRAALAPAREQDLYRRYVSTTVDGFRRGACFCLASAYQTLQSRADFSIALRQEAVVVWGTEDRTHALTDRHSILREIPHARMVEFSGCGHFPSLEATERYLPILCG